MGSDMRTMGRLQTVRTALAASLDGAIVSSPENVFNVTGLSADLGRARFAVVRPRRKGVGLQT